MTETDTDLYGKENDKPDLVKKSPELVKDLVKESKNEN